MSIHVPVMSDEVLEALDPKPGFVLLDGTMGGGGHTRLLAERVRPDGQVIALDRDFAAVEAAEAWRGELPITSVCANYNDAVLVLRELDIEKLDGAVLDLGLSSDQLADDERGFSFDSPGSFDLRYDTDSGEPAWRLLNRLSAEHMADLIYNYGEERMSRRIARALVRKRDDGAALDTALEVADVVRRAAGREYEKRIDPATRTFQAFRIAVNDELRFVEQGVKQLPGCLKVGGKLAVISFHSLEDRLVKHALRDDPRLEVETRRPLQPTEAEIDRNPRARSAKLRVARRI